MGRWRSRGTVGFGHWLCTDRRLHCVSYFCCCFVVFLCVLCLTYVERIILLLSVAFTMYSQVMGAASGRNLHTHRQASAHLKVGMRGDRQPTNIQSRHTAHICASSTSTNSHAHLKVGAREDRQPTDTQIANTARIWYAHAACMHTGIPG